MADPSTPDDIGASSTPDDANASTPQPAADGSEPDTNTGNSQDPAMVPSDRLREETRKRQEAEERAARFEKELEAKNQPEPDPEEDDDDEEIDPKVSSLVTKIIKKQGYVKKEDVQASVNQLEGRRQYREDTTELTSKYAKSSVPFVESDIVAYAKDKGINLRNKASMEAAYRDMNFDKITDAARKAAITEFKEGTGSEGEKPGGSDGKPHDPEPEVRGIKTAYTQQHREFGLSLDFIKWTAIL